MASTGIRETSHRKLITDYLKTIDQIPVDQIIIDRIYFLLDRLEEMESKWVDRGGFIPGSTDESRFMGSYDRLNGKLITYCTAMGMTLASRIRLNITGKKEKTDDLLEKLQKE